MPEHDSCKGFSNYVDGQWGPATCELEVNMRDRLTRAEQQSRRQGSNKVEEMYQDLGWDEAEDER